MQRMREYGIFFCRLDFVLDSTATKLKDNFSVLELECNYNVITDNIIYGIIQCLSECKTEMGSMNLLSWTIKAENY